MSRGNRSGDERYEQVKPLEAYLGQIVMENERSREKIVHTKTETSKKREAKGRTHVVSVGTGHGYGLCVFVLTPRKAYFCADRSTTLRKCWHHWLKLGCCTIETEG